MNETVNPNARFAATYANGGIAINHVGYETAEPKFAVIVLADDQAPFDLAHVRAGSETLFSAELAEPVEVADWRGQRYQLVDFSDLRTTGEVYIEVESSLRTERSESFTIADKIYADKFPPALLSYFKSQREGEPWLSADRSIPFIGTRNSRADVHGGWYDASGDVSKYLSHLSYANTMNPQQTPLIVWALAKAAICPHIEERQRPGFRAEALYGADFLVRMCDPEGMFYMTVFDRWSGDTAQREICSYSTQKGHKHDTWQAGYRQGGGMAIAALARVARFEHAGDYPAARYLEVAKQAFAHLEAHNLEYLDDGKENIIDDYCALLAAIELTRSTNGEKPYREAARRRAASLMDRLTAEGWWSADGADLPFFHAADEGLPVAALVDYLAIADIDEAMRVKAVLNVAAEHLLAVTGEVENPFAYPRQFVRQSGGRNGTQFFYPHVNPSGYWWQGENARLAGLSYALRRAMPYLDEAIVPAATAQAQRQLDWILGANPFHSCMLQGFGRNDSVYAVAKFPNVDGGICNGITSSLTDESAIAFCETEDPMQSWRWSEQWLPHAAWFLLAMTEY